MTVPQQQLLIFGGFVVLVWAVGGYIAWRDKHPRIKPSWRCGVCGRSNPMNVSRCQRPTFGEVGYSERQARKITPYNGYNGVLYGDRPECKGRKP